MDKSYYKHKLHKGVYIPPQKKYLYQKMNVDHCPRWLLDEIKWFQFQGILEHADFHAKGNNILLHQ